MLHPSYKEMMGKLNEDLTDDRQEVVSRYSLVMAAAKRARQVNDGSEPLVDVQPNTRNLSVAVKELYAGQVHILKKEEE